MRRHSGFESRRSGKRWTVAALAVLVMIVAAVFITNEIAPPASRSVRSSPVAANPPSPTRESEPTPPLREPEPAPPSRELEPASPAREKTTAAETPRVPPVIELPAVAKAEPERTPPPLQPSRSLPDPSVAPPAATSRAPEVPAEAPPVSPAPPSVTETPAQAPDHELTAVGSVLDEYQQLFNRRDAGAAPAIWPRVDEPALRRMFAQLQSQTLSFDECSIVMADRAATARCVGLLQYVPRVGSNKPRSERHTWTIELRRAPEGWHIVTVDAR